MAKHPTLRTLLVVTTLLGAGWAAPFSARAAGGDAASLFSLALRYEHAEGVPRDYGHALELFCAAASQGHADATFNIAWIYLNGRGVARDDAVGAAWLRLAVGRGHAFSAHLLDRLGAIPAVKATGCREPESAVPSIKAAGVLVPPTEIVRLVAETAAAYKVDPKLVLAVIAAESAFQTDAVSPRNARGLMQLMPETAQRFGVKNVFDAGENIRGGTQYLRWLLTYFEDDLSLTLAAYNAGEGAVARYGGIPPFPETRAYVQKVRALYRPEHHFAERKLGEQIASR
jgi:soluble lytic murein transglycosylase-like protein